MCCVKVMCSWRTDGCTFILVFKQRFKLSIFQLHGSADLFETHKIVQTRVGTSDCSLNLFFGCWAIRWSSVIGVLKANNISIWSTLKATCTFYSYQCNHLQIFESSVSFSIVLEADIGQNVKRWWFEYKIKTIVKKSFRIGTDICYALCHVWNLNIVWSCVYRFAIDLLSLVLGATSLKKNFLLVLETKVDNH